MTDEARSPATEMPTAAALIAYAKAHPVPTDDAAEKKRDAAWRRAERFAEMIANG